MSNAVEIVPFVLAVAAFALAALRPWWGVVALLAALPFNTFLVLVVGDVLRLDGIARIVWAGWKDAMVAGFVLATIAAVVGRELDPLRFRANLLVEPADGAAFAEDGWVGAVLRVGEAMMRVDRPDERCAVVNVDPATAERDPAVLKAIGRERRARLGVYGSTVRPGRVAVGDPVVLTAAGASGS